MRIREDRDDVVEGFQSYLRDVKICGGYFLLS